MNQSATQRTMRIAQMEDFRQPIIVSTVPLDAMRPDGAIIRVEASGVCRSDWHFWNHDMTWLGMDLDLPCNTGHEVGGIVEEVGALVHNVKVGDRVTIPFHEADGTCPQCRHGKPNLCDNMIMPGVGRLGGWAEYVTVTAADLNCINLPDEVSTLAAAALGCRFMTGYHAAVRANVLAGRWMGVHGCGGVGLSAIQTANAQGSLVIAIDIDDAKLEKARAEGATATVNAKGLKPEQVAEAVKDATDGGVMGSVDALGGGVTFTQSVLSLRKGGRHVQAGMTSQADKGVVQLPLDMLTMMELEIVGSMGNPHPDYAELLDLCAKGRLAPDRLISKEIGLDEISDTLNRMDHFDTEGFEVITRFQ